MVNVKAINYTGFNYQSIGEEETKKNLYLMQKKTACNAVIIVLGAIQEDVYSVNVDYKHPVMPKDADLIDFIKYAKQLGLQVFLKPVIDCEDGSCRTDIDFMKDGEFQEEAWKQWFQNYSEFILHYAKIAEKTNCEMFFIGCRLLKLVAQADAWRSLIEQVRSNYQGRITYEANAFFEKEVPFWDSLDVIATSGNYSKHQFAKGLKETVELAEELKKELYLTECGCMSMKGASQRPDTWDIEGMLSLQEQVDFLQVVFENCSRQNCVRGIGIWCWNNRRQSAKSALHDKRYYIYGKPACEYIHQVWKEVDNRAAI